VKKGKVKEAHEDFERSLRWAEFPDAYVQLGRAALDRGDLESAHKFLNQAIEIDERFGPAHETLGYLFLQWDDSAEAARAFEQALVFGHATADLYRGVWTAYMAIEKLERAHELILEGVETFPKNDRLQLAAGNSFVYAKGDSAEAEPFWKKAAELNPRNIDAHFQLAGLNASRGKRKEALSFLAHCSDVDFEGARKLWKEDKELPFHRFMQFENDPDFIELLGR
jgi:tetratricopeptide (TPR) repeat protein